MLSRFAPWLFVLLWSTGFIGARFGLPHAEPLSFLSVRYALVLCLLLPLALATRARWPHDGRQWLHIGISGLLIHGIYLGGVFVAISRGLSTGITALVVGMQPLLTAFAAAILLQEAVSRRQWAGLALGLLGVALVVAGKVGAGGTAVAMLPAVIALLGITTGTLYQKRFCPSFDLRSGAFVQFLPTAVATAAAAAIFEDFRIEWTGEFAFALGWLVMVLSVGAIALLNFLIRSGSAVNVASLFYLVPPTTALLGWMAFGEMLTPLMLVGMALAAGGVYLSRR